MSLQYKNGEDALSFWTDTASSSIKTANFLKILLDQIQIQASRIVSCSKAATIYPPSFVISACELEISRKMFEMTFDKDNMGGGVVEWFRALIWNLEVPCSNPPPHRYLDFFSVVPSSTPRPRCVNSQLVSLPPVGILNSLCSICNICLYICSVSDYHNSAKYIWQLNKVIYPFISY